MTVQRNAQWERRWGRFIQQPRWLPSMCQPFRCSDWLGVNLNCVQRHFGQCPLKTILGNREVSVKFANWSGDVRLGVSYQSGEKEVVVFCHHTHGQDLEEERQEVIFTENRTNRIIIQLLHHPLPPRPSPVNPSTPITTVQGWLSQYRILVFDRLAAHCRRG